MPDCEKCDNEAMFWVEEKYLSSDGEVGVDRLEAVCREHAEEAEPNGLRDPLGPGYEFSISFMDDEFY